MTKKSLPKSYKTQPFEAGFANEPAAAYMATASLDDRNILKIINAVREGFSFAFFTSIARNSPFTLTEWSGYLHLSERSMQRYKKEKKSFDPIYSEKIFEIMLLMNMGLQVFKDQEKYNTWLESKNIALGGAKPKDFLDSTFGISFLKDELLKIQHGVLA